nr:apolipoprotein N-acyltransferase [Rhabdothermincola salaria]
MAASVPPWGWWPAAFVGVALWDRAIAGRTARSRFLRSWLLGAVWLMPATLWMWDLTAPGYLVAGALFGAYVGVAGALVPSPPGRPWVRWLALPGALVLCEAARWSFPFGGVPLATTAMSQAAAPLGQVARVGSAIGVVLAVGVVGVALSAAWERRWGVAGALVVGVAVLWGLASVAPRGEAVGDLTVALVQGGGPQRTRAADTDPWEVFQRHLEASDDVTTPVDLVLWPENVISVEGPLTDSREHRELVALARRLDTTLVIGATEGVDAERFTNFAAVYDADGDLGDRYDKVRRVPFGEYVPFRSLVESVAGSASLTRRDAVIGEEPAVLETPAGPFSLAISWEIFFTDRVREGVEFGGQAVLNPTNGSSYWLTQVQSQQVASSRLRAIETGRWVLQAAPTGFSAVVTPEGEVVARTGVSERRVLEETIERREGLTIATRIGPLPVVGLGGLLVVAAWVLARRTTSPTGSPDEDDVVLDPS